MEFEGTIVNGNISILIDHATSLSYIKPQLVEKCKLKSKKTIEIHA